jgi:hypothetical protein
MMYEQIENFVDGLIKKTKEKKIEWKPLNMLVDYDIFEKELMEITSIQSDLLVEHINYRFSYFFPHKEGYIVLCSVSMKNKYTNTQHNELLLLTKICPTLSLDSSGNHPLIQTELETLKLIIENGIYAQYDFPDTLYNFWADILK